MEALDARLRRCERLLAPSGPGGDGAGSVAARLRGCEEAIRKNVKVKRRTLSKGAWRGGGRPAPDGLTAATAAMPCALPAVADAERRCLDFLQEAHSDLATAAKEDFILANRDRLEHALALAARIAELCKVIDAPEFRGPCGRCSPTRHRVRAALPLG